ncbi:hypothetical protein QT238_15130 [Geobacillus stearothermophilus]|nr:hypothetical protein QT238_15130 [Geobacillus stearothermophilus]
MKVVIIVAIAVVMLFLLAAFMKLSVTVVFRHMKDDDECKIVVRTLFGLIRYTIRIPLIKLETESEAPGVAFIHKKGMGGRAARKKRKENGRRKKSPTFSAKQNSFWSTSSIFMKL